MKLSLHIHELAIEKIVFFLFGLDLLFEGLVVLKEVGLHVGKDVLITREKLLI